MFLTVDKYPLQPSYLAHSLTRDSLSLPAPVVAPADDLAARPCRRLAVPAHCATIADAVPLPMPRRSAGHYAAANAALPVHADPVPLPAPADAVPLPARAPASVSSSADEICLHIGRRNYF